MFFYIRGRKLWTKYPNTAFVKVRWRGKRVVERVHHTADSGVPANATPAQEMAYLRRIEDYHIKTNGWAGIGYSYLIFPSGRCYEGRGFEKLGAHTPGHNADWAVSFVGNFDKIEPTKAALKAERKLRRKLLRKGVFGKGRKGHGETYPTACPGKYLRRALGLKG